MCDCNRLQYNPDKLRDPDFVDNKLRQYAGREDELFKRLRLKYNVSADGEPEEETEQQERR